MALPIGIDVTQLDRLAADIATSGKTVPTVIRPVMSKAGLQMKTKGAAEARGHKHAPRLPGAWSYDLKDTPMQSVVEVGPREGGQGSLAMYYFGNSKVGPSLPDPVHILDEEADVTAEVLVTIASKALRLL